MRKTLVYIACLLWSFQLAFTCYGQEENLFQKAYDLRENRKFDEAIEVYKALLAQDTFIERHPFSYSRIADCYMALNKKEDAKNYYRAALLTGKGDVSYAKRRYAIPLLDFYLAEKKYDSVLYFINYVNTLRQTRVMCGANRIESRTPINHRMMLAYEGLGQIDVAIKSFLPYAFQEWTNNIGTEFCTEHIYEDDYHCQLQDFLRVVYKKYSKEYVKKQVVKLVEHSLFSITKEMKGNNCELDIKGEVVFLNERIIIENWGTSCDLDEKAQTENNKAYKKWFLDQVAHSLLYQQFSAANF